MRNISLWNETFIAQNNLLSAKFMNSLNPAVSGILHMIIYNFFSLLSSCDLPSKPQIKL